MDDRPTTLQALLARSVSEHGDRTALVTAGSRLTYEDLAKEVDSCASALVASGVGKGTRVALLMENDPDWVVFALAVTGIGALFVPLSTFSHADDLEHHLRMADVSHLFTVPEFLGNDYLGALAEIAPEIGVGRAGSLYCERLPALRDVVVRGGGDLASGYRSWDGFMSAGSEVPDPVLRGLRDDLDPEDYCYLLTTSGTTARPKGVLHSHRALALNGARIGELQGLNHDDVVWFYFPLFFSAGCVNVMLGALSAGASLILQPAFDPGSALELIERERATTWHLWPHQLSALLEHPDWGTRDHSELHKGTAPYDALRASPHPDGLGGVNMYGMTETATAFACTPAADPLQTRISTQGRVLSGNELVVVDPDTGERLPAGSPGEILVKGPTVMRRYYKVDPATTFDGEGFFHTGDLGYLDDDGRLHFERRLKEVIKTGGINVSPAEVEAALIGIDGVDAAYAFPIPGGDRGEHVGAALVAADAAALSERSVTEHCREALPAHKRPRAVLVVTPDQVPMTGSGKVRKNALRDALVDAVERGAGTFVRL